MSIEELKNCPFCGSGTVNDTTEPEDDGGGYFLVCPECVAVGPIADSAESAKELWNRRKTKED